MFDRLDRDDFANVAKIIGAIILVVSLFLPAVTPGYPQSLRDYLVTNDAYHGWACVAWTLWGSVAFIASLFNPSGQGVNFFFVVSGWITPLVVVFGAVADNITAKRRFARALPFLMVFPFLFFASPEPGWGPGPFRPLIGHYVWTVGCLLIFTPQYAGMLRSKRKNDNESPGEH
ncbi:MAG: hypothetical protein ABSF28_09030 [Terracidiphilus sp.]|jgi:hypothetical protein